MATRQAKTAEVVELPQTFPDVVDPESIIALRETLGITDDADTSVHVYLIDPESKIDSKIWDGDADAFNLGSLAKVFGSGQYRVKVYARNAEGYKPLRYNRIQGWTLSPEDEGKVQTAKYAARNPQVAPAQHNGVDMREALRESLAPIVAAFNRPPPDPFAEMEKLAGLMKSLMPAPVVPVAPGPDLMSMLTMLKTLKELTGNDVPADATVTEKLLLKAADAFMPHVAAGMQAQGGAPAPAEPQPAPVAALEAPKPELPIDEEAEQMKIIDRLKVEGFKLQLIAANKAAARGVDPAEYANSIYDMFEDADVEGIATQPNWFESICQAVPGCRVHQVWYTAMREKIVDMAVEDGLLLRDEAGNLTVPGDSGTSEFSADQSAQGKTDGVANAGTGTAAAESKPV